MDLETGGRIVGAAGASASLSMSDVNMSKTGKPESMSFMSYITYVFVLASGTCIHPVNPQKLKHKNPDSHMRSSTHPHWYFFLFPSSPSLTVSTSQTVACACFAMAINGAPLVLAVGCISLIVAPVVAYQRYLLGNMESKLLLLLLLSHLIFIFLLLFSPNNDAKFIMYVCMYAENAI